MKTARFLSSTRSPILSTSAYLTAIALELIMQGRSLGISGKRCDRL
ncbi:MAG: hypothetical protein H7Z11_24655 [Verrucomicrobia bacterium]|nr:hypothetical protein [Leptolyngbya sp. ES-bin-22]